MINKANLEPIVEHIIYRMNDNMEQNWVKKAKQGDSAAIAELFRCYWRAARATAYGVTGDFNLAEDAASEALYAAFDGLKNLRDIKRFGPWLHTIVIRTAKRLKISQSKEKELELQIQPNTQSEVPSANLEQQELIALIHEAVRNLSETLREAISLFYFEGYSIEEASRFLDIPIGTFKRRLHDGRNRLYDVAGRIIKGKKTFDPKQTQILQKFKDLVNKGRDSTDSLQVIKQVLQLRPLPYELMAKFLKQHSHTAKKMATLEGREEVRHRSHKVMEFLSKPSDRSLNPAHLVCKVANAIRTALPEFKERQVDVSLAAQRLVQGLSGNLDSLYLPPELSEGIPGSYMYLTRWSLFQADDGSLQTMYSLVQNKDAKNLNDKLFINNGRLSDVLVLMWLQSCKIELREVEELLLRLSKVITSKIPIRFISHDEPSFRSALCMQFEDIPIPAAIGGPLNSFPNTPEGISIARVQLFLESWATAQSGQVIELVELSPLLNIIRNDHT